MTMGYGIAGPESATSPIGPINLQTKLAGKPGTGKPYAGFDEAGAGDGPYGYRASPRPYLRGESDRKARDLPDLLKDPPAISKGYAQ